MKKQVDSGADATLSDGILAERVNRSMTLAWSRSAQGGRPTTLSDARTHDVCATGFVLER
jgi:hypothetical protein